MSTAENVLDLTRSMMNDDDQVMWPDYRLLPKLQMAYNDLVNRITLSDHEILFEQSSKITVPANTADGVNVDITALSGYPTNLRVPMTLLERPVGGMDSDYTLMYMRSFLPHISKTNANTYWTWQKNKIIVLGALQDREMLIQYKGTLSQLTDLSSDIVIPGAENFLAFKTAAMALGSLPVADQRTSRYDEDAEIEALRLMKIVTKQNQARPARRIGYRKRWYRPR